MHEGGQELLFTYQFIQRTGENVRRDAKPVGDASLLSRLSRHRTCLLKFLIIAVLAKLIGAE